MVLVVLVLTASSSAYADAQVRHSIWTGPWHPSVSSTQTAEFVALWSTRIADDAWMENYFAQRTFPDSVLAEGFHAKDTHTKMYLADQLFEHLLRLDPKTRARANTILAVQSLSTDQSEAWLYRSIFEKDWSNSLRDQIDTTVGTPEPSKPAPLTPLQQSVKRLEKVRTVHQPQTDVPASMRFARPQRPSFGTWFAGLDTNGIDLNPPLPRIHAMADAGGALSPLTYRVCSQIGAAAAVCDGELPLGVPHLIDVNADGSNDELALLGLDPLTQVGTLSGLSLSFRALKLAGGTTLPAHLFFTVDVPQAAKRIAVGFDGRTSSLADDATVSVNLLDLAQAIAGNVALGLSVSNSNPGPASAVTFKVQDIAGAGAVGTSPVTGSLGFNPTPAFFNGVVGMNRIVGADEYTIKINSSERPKLTVGLISEREPASRRDMKVVVDKLPTDLSVVLKTPDKDHMSIAYKAQQTIDTLSFDDVQTPDTAMPGNITTIHGQVEGIPANFDLTVDSSSAMHAVYNASSGIPAASFTYRQFANGENPVTETTEPYKAIAAGVQGLPSTLDLTADLAGGSITWNADAPVTAVTAAAHFPKDSRFVDAGLSINDIPAQWSVLFPSDSITFRGISGPIGLVSAALTNHNTITTYPGNHASVVSNASSGDLDASFAMSQISVVDVRPTTSGFTTDLQMGGGNPFRAHADYLGSRKLLADVTLTPLPSSIQITQAGDDFSYTGSVNFDLLANVQFGSVAALAATPTPPTPHGVAIRDGRSCFFTFCTTAVKANVFLRGCPTGLQMLTDNSTGPKLIITNFNPVSVNSLSLDAILNYTLSKALTASVTQYGIPSPVSFTFGPIATTTLGDGSKRTSLSYTSTKPLGALYASVDMAADNGYLYISNIPSSVSVVITAGNPNTTASINTAQSITSLSAYYRHVGDSSYGAGVTLSQIPTAMNLTFGRIATSSTAGDITAPGLTYSANASTLDINAFVNASLFGGDVKAKVTLGVANLGQTVNAYFSSGKLRMTSSPATTNLEIHTWGRISYLKNIQKCLPSCGDSNRFQVSGHAGVVPLLINDLMVKLTNFSDLTVTPGITSGVQGTFGSFQFGWSSITVTIDFEVHVEVCFTGGGCPDVLPELSYHNTIPINVLFTIGGNHTEIGWIDWETGIVICDVGWFDATAYDIEVDINPHMHTWTWNSFVLGTPPASEGSAYTVTPNPSGIFSWGVMQVVAALTSPFSGSGFSFHLRCN
jgi:hypothetical protein